MEPLRIETNPIKRFINNVRTSAMIALGNALNLFAPGFVRPVDCYDQLTRTHLKIEVCTLFTIISVDGRDYYFYRLTGGYDGSGMSADGYAKLHNVSVDNALAHAQEQYDSDVVS
jgi:hypothetical protein